MAGNPFKDGQDRFKHASEEHVMADTEKELQVCQDFIVEHDLPDKARVGSLAHPVDSLV